MASLCISTNKNTNRFEFAKFNIKHHSKEIRAASVGSWAPFYLEVGMNSVVVENPQRSEFSFGLRYEPMRVSCRGAMKDVPNSCILDRDRKTSQRQKLQIVMTSLSKTTKHTRTGHLIVYYNQNHMVLYPCQHFRQSNLRVFSLILIISLLFPAESLHSNNCGIHWNHMPVFTEPSAQEALSNWH